LSVRDFVFEQALRRGRRALPVVEDGQLIGIVSLTDAKHLSQEAWASTPVSQVMTRVPLKTLAPEADLAAALEMMVDSGVHQLPIVRDGTLVGMLTRGDVMRYLQLGQELHARDSSQSGTATTTRPRTAISHS
jgi:CBS domain-containing protein